MGYGDITPTPGNTAEQAVALALLIMGSIAWGLVLAVIVSNLANIDPEGDDFTQTMGELNKMMIRQNLPQPMRVRLREYFHQSRHVRIYSKHIELLTLMSTLQSEVSFEFARDWLARVVPRATDDEFSSSSRCSSSRWSSRPARSRLPESSTLSRAALRCSAGVCSKGRIFGDDMILTSLHLQNGFAARAMNYLEVLTIERRQLEETAAAFPEVAAMLRKASIRLAVRRAFLRGASPAKHGAVQRLDAAAQRHEFRLPGARRRRVVQELGYFQAEQAQAADDAKQARLWRSRPGRRSLGDGEAA